MICSTGKCIMTNYDPEPYWDTTEVPIDKPWENALSNTSSFINNHMQLQIQNSGQKKWEVTLKIKRPQ